MASIGQELLNVPMGDMIHQMAEAIAEGQYKLDENSINVAEMMGGLTTVYDEEGKVSFDDSRVFFGYEYMSLKEAQAFALADDAITGTMGNDVIKLSDMIGQIDEKWKEDLSKMTAEEKALLPDQENPEIRVPTRLSMMELGFTPTFYQFVDTIIEVKIAIKITRTRSYTKKRSNANTDKSNSYRRKRSFWGTSKSSGSSSNVSTSQVDATYSSKYSYTAEGASLLRTKLSTVPPPAILEERIRGLMENEAARKETALEIKRKQAGLDTPTES